RHHVVQRQVARSHAAVLTRVVVANENFAARQPYARPRSLDHVNEPNHRRSREEPIRCADGMVRVLEDFRLAAVHQNQSSSRVANIEWLVVLVQHQDSAHLYLPARIKKPTCRVTKTERIVAATSSE